MLNHTVIIIVYKYLAYNYNNYIAALVHYFIKASYYAHTCTTSILNNRYFC